MNRTITFSVVTILSILILSTGLFAGLFQADAKSELPLAALVSSDRVLDVTCASQRRGERQIDVAKKDANSNLTEVMNLMTCYN